MTMIQLAESRFLPDALIRMGIRRLLRKRIRLESKQNGSESAQFADMLRTSPLAIETQAANQQHYEVPAEFFQAMLGPRLKYSGCLFPSDRASLAEAEEAMLQLTCKRAELAGGMEILELGCGWGSLTIWMAQHYPDCQITALSNSASQRRFIEQKLDQQGLDNVRVITADIREFTTNQQFDRVVSVEMFEHMRNYEILFRRIASWLKPDGKLFAHIFCHRDTPYLFETEGSENWMGRHFFTGGTMPSEHLFDQFAADLMVEQQWRVGGVHYWRTCEAWLKNLDANRSAITARFQQDLSPREAAVQVQRWRMFLMACAELFRFRGGEEWFVAHYLMQPQSISPTDRLTTAAAASVRHA